MPARCACFRSTPVPRTNSRRRPQRRAARGAAQQRRQLVAVQVRTGRRSRAARRAPQPTSRRRERRPDRAGRRRAGRSGSGRRGGTRRRYRAGAGGPRTYDRPASEETGRRTVNQCTRWTTPSASARAPVADGSHRALDSVGDAAPVADRDRRDDAGDGQRGDDEPDEQAGVVTAMPVDDDRTRGGQPARRRVPLKRGTQDNTGVSTRLSWHSGTDRAAVYALTVRPTTSDAPRASLGRHRVGPVSTMLPLDAAVVVQWPPRTQRGVRAT
jgi:hypothetical protein